MKPLGVVPVDPSQSGQLQIFDRLPWTALGAHRSTDQFGFVVAVDGLGQGVDAPIVVNCEFRRCGGLS